MEKRKLRRPYGTLQYLKGTNKNAGKRLFTRVCGDRIKRNGFKLNEGRIRLDIRKKSLTRKGGKRLEQAVQRGG